MRVSEALDVGSVLELRTPVGIGDLDLFTDQLLYERSGGDLPIVRRAVGEDEAMDLLGTDSQGDGR